MAIGPQQYLEISSEHKIVELEKVLDEELLKYAESNTYPWVSLLVNSEYSAYVRNIVAKKICRNRLVFCISSDFNRKW